MAKDFTQVNFRIPTALKKQIDQASLENDCSITCELVNRLENSFIVQDKQPLYLSENSIRELTMLSNLSLQALVQNLIKNGVSKEIIAASLPDYQAFKEVIDLSKSLDI